KLPRESGQPAGRNLLAANLDQELAIHYAPPADDASDDSPTYACAILTASCRTRRMYAVRSVTPMLPLESRMLKRWQHIHACSSAGQIRPESSSWPANTKFLSKRSRCRAANSAAGMLT